MENVPKKMIKDQRRFVLRLCFLDIGRVCTFSVVVVVMVVVVDEVIDADGEALALPGRSLMTSEDPCILPVRKSLNFSASSTALRSCVSQPRKRSSSTDPTISWSSSSISMPVD